MSSGLSVVYIAGASRSGSTVLAMLLGSLPGAVSIGELRHLWRRGIQLDQRCGCGAAFSECPFWSDVGRIAFGGWENAPADRMIELQRTIDRFRHLPKLGARSVIPGFRRLVQEYADVSAAVYRAVQEASGAAMVIDSSKSVSFSLVLGAMDGVTPSVVHLVRDSRAVAHSWTRRRELPEVRGATEYMATYSPLQTAFVWNRSNFALDAIRHLGAPSTRIRYEELMKRNSDELRRLADAIGVSHADVMRLAGPAVPVGVQHTVAGNPSRFARGSVELRSDEEWRSKMGARDRRLVGLLTWPLLKSYGYTRPG